MARMTIWISPLAWCITINKNIPSDTGKILVEQFSTSDLVDNPLCHCCQALRYRIHRQLVDFGGHHLSEQVTEGAR